MTGEGRTEEEEREWPSEEVSLGQAELERSEPARWRRAVLVNKEGRALVYPNLHRRLFQKGIFLVPEGMETGSSLLLRSFPLQHQAPKTVEPRRPAQPSEALKELVRSNISCWQECFAPSDACHISWYNAAAATDERANVQGFDNHRPRLRHLSPHNPNEGILVGPEGYSETARKVMSAGFSLKVEDDGKVSVSESGLPPSAGWGFDAHELLEAGIAVNWPDRELLFFLRWGFRDYSDRTPPVTFLAPHLGSAANEAELFYAAVQSEVDAGWLGPPQSFPPFVPCRAVPGVLWTRRRPGQSDLYGTAQRQRPESGAAQLLSERRRCRWPQTQTQIYRESSALSGHRSTRTTR